MTYSTQIRHYAETLKGNALSPNPSQENSRHQLRVLENLAKHQPDLEKARLDLKNLSAGVVISDYGKTPEAKKLLTTESDDSNLLISSLQGKDESQASKLINKLLSTKFGNEKANLINPNLTAKEVREQFGRDSRLLGFFHELPGLLLLIKDYNAGELNEKQFTSQFWASFAHNGPQKGFWNTLAGMINKDREAKHIDLHQGTVFSNDKGDLVYPDPEAEAVLHTAYDRFDQATEGLPKIAREMSSWADLKDIKSNLLGTNSSWTNEQLDELAKVASKHQESNPELGFIGQTISNIKTTITRLADFVKDRMSWTDENGTQSLSFKHPDGTVETLSKKADNNYEHKIDIKQAANKQEFVDRNSAQFLARVVRNFKEEDRYTQAI